MDLSIEAKTRNIFGENIRKYFHDLGVDKFRQSREIRNYQK